MATFLGKSGSSCSSYVLSIFMFIPGLAFSYLKCVFQSGDYLSYNVTLAMTGLFVDIENGKSHVQTTCEKLYDLVMGYVV